MFSRKRGISAHKANENLSREGNQWADPGTRDTSGAWREQQEDFHGRRRNPKREAVIAHLIPSARPPAALAKGGKAFRGSKTETGPKYGEEAGTVGIGSLVGPSQHSAGTSHLLGPDACSTVLCEKKRQHPWRPRYGYTDGTHCAEHLEPGRSGSESNYSPCMCWQAAAPSSE